MGQSSGVHQTRPLRGECRRGRERGYVRLSRLGVAGARGSGWPCAGGARRLAVIAAIAVACASSIAGTAAACVTGCPRDRWDATGASELLQRRAVAHLVEDALDETGRGGLVRGGRGEGRLPRRRRAA